MKRDSTQRCRGELVGGRSSKLRRSAVGRWVGRCTTVYSHRLKEAERAVSIQTNAGDNDRMLPLLRMLHRMPLLLRVLMPQRILLQRMLVLQRMLLLRLLQKMLNRMLLLQRMLVLQRMLLLQRMSLLQRVMLKLLRRILRRIFWWERKS